MSTTAHEVAAANIRAHMAHQRISARTVCAAIGMRPSTFSRKLNGVVPFAFDEVDAVLAVIGLGWQDLAAALESPRPLPAGIQREINALNRP